MQDEYEVVIDKQDAGNYRIWMLLIWAVNKWAPEETVAQKSAPAAKAIASIDATTKAIIDATVSQITGGKGRASKITKM